MHTGKAFRSIFGILTLTCGLFLAACGDSSVALAPIPTTSPATTAALATPPTTTSTTTAPATTPAATTPSATTPATTVALATTVAGTTAAAGQPGSGKAAELLSNIPNSATYLKLLSYNNYLAFRKVNNIPADATFSRLTSDKEAFTRFNNGSRFLTPSQLMAFQHFQTLRDLAGFDMLQADYDTEAGQPPNFISLAQGNFDTTAIDKAWTAGGAIKDTAGSNTSYTINEVDLSKNLQHIFIGKLALIPVPAQKSLVYGKPPTAATAVAGELPSKNPVTGNPAVKGLLDVFGDPISLYMGSSLIGSSSNNPPDTSPGTAKATQGTTIKATRPVPVPVVGGYAFYQDETGARTYLVANYYTDPASAQAAQPLLLDRLKNGVSRVTRAPYSQYWEVVSSEIKGNALVFKLNWKHLNGLSQFVFARDFPAFLT